MRHFLVFLLLISSVLFLTGITEAKNNSTYRHKSYKSTSLKNYKLSNLKPNKTYSSNAVTSNAYKKKSKGIFSFFNIFKRAPAKKRELPKRQDHQPSVSGEKAGHSVALSKDGTDQQDIHQETTETEHYSVPSLQ